MARPKKQPQKLGIVSNYAGKTVSINLKKRTYFGIGDETNSKGITVRKLWLGPETWYATIPDNLTAQEADQVAMALETGDLIEGKEWIPPVDKDRTVLNYYVGLIVKHRRLDEEFKEEVRSLFRHKKAGNYTALEIFRAMKEKEVATNNRSNFLSYLDEAMENYQGPVQLVQDFPNDPGNYTVAIDPATLQVVSTDKPAQERLGDMEFKGLDNPEERAAALENALE